MDRLEEAAKAAGGIALEDQGFAQFMDSRDPLAFLRNEFEIPSMNQVAGNSRDGGDDYSCTYLCGNSLGLQPKRARVILNEEMDEWAARGVAGHHRHSKDRAWVGYRKQIVEKMAPLFGAKPVEVGVMGTLTANLHIMLAAFYRPTAERFKILIESKAFPSDHYAVESQLQWHKLSPDAMLLAKPRDGELTLRTSDILELIEREGSAIAVVMLSGVQFYTGQAFEIEKITAAAHAKGCIVGWDLAHAAGNIPLRLHDWDVDFACWCTYKYMNSGPGGISGFFVHQRYARDTSLPRLLGWWAHDESTRFDMTNSFVPNEGAAGFEISNTPIMTAATLLGSLQVFELTSMDELHTKSVLLTTYLEYLLNKRVGDGHMQIITPKECRGAQLSLLFDAEVFEPLFQALADAGVICDERKPNCIRIAPVPLYNTFNDVWKCVDTICRALDLAA
ncbi:Kynureninase (L-kynurenine hydrolase) [Coemansia sp. BCRC 34490]|nr:Kynureninase (L-kynurenine hydrolase) [Coemansia sp. BCRC 34490]